MKKAIFGIIVVVFAVLMAVPYVHAQCITIQDGILQTSINTLITTGYDEWGYNYQAHLFNGKYCDAYRNADWCQAYKDIDIEMK